MWINYAFLMVTGLSAGLLISCGVFTVLFVIGLIPRFAGKTHTGNKIIWYEESVIWGTAVGGIFSLFNRWLNLQRYLGEIGSLWGLSAIRAPVSPR